MSSKTYQPVHHTTIHQGVSFPVIVTGNSVATDPPIIVVGDVVGASAGSYFTFARSVAGTYTLTTIEAFPKMTKCIASYLAATPDIRNFIELGVPVQNANNTWTIPFITSIGGSKADLPAGDGISFDLEFSNTKVVP